MSIASISAAEETFRSPTRSLNVFEEVARFHSVGSTTENRVGL